MGVRLASFVVWFAVAACGLFWGLRLMARPLAAPAHALAVQSAAGGGGADVSRLLGVAAPPLAVAADAPVSAPADSRFKLLGVVAPRGTGGDAGLALIAVDGKPPRAFGLGATVDTPLVVLAVQHRGVQLGPRGGPVQLRLELPALPPPQRGQPAQVAAAVPPPPLPLAQPLQPVPPPPGVVQAPPTAVMPQPMSTVR